MAKKLIGNGTVLTLGDDNRVIEDGAVLIDGTDVKEIGTTTDLRARHKDAELIDAKHGTILPGFICAHHHLYSTFACGLGAKPAANFVEVLENLWWKLDRALTLDDVELSAAIPVVRAIRSGTTTILDHHASPAAIRGSLDRVAEVTLKAGVRASLCYEITDRNGEQGASDGIEESRAFLARARADKSGLLHGMVGLHAAMTIGPKTLERAVALAQQEGAGLHVHVAEDKADQDDSLAKYKVRIIERLAKAGALGPRSMAIHCIHLDDKEIDLLAETRTNVVHNPQSNMNNAVGAARVLEMIKKGVRVGLGTDGMTSNMLEEVRVALWLRHHEAKDPRPGFVECAMMLLGANPAIASSFFGKKLGALAVGAPADVVVSAHIPYTPISPANVLGHILFGVASAPIRTTVVNGVTLMQDGELKTLDWEEISARAKKLSGATWDRFAKL